MGEGPPLEPAELKALEATYGDLGRDTLIELLGKVAMRPAQPSARTPRAPPREFVLEEE